MALLSPEASQSLRLAYVDLFLFAGRMRDGDVPAARVGDLREWVDGELKRVHRDLMRADIDDQVIADAEMALIALLDESAQNSRSREFAEPWMKRPLQLDRYRHNNLGTEFFRRLDYLRERPDVPVELLEQFARSLTWGFEGRYRDENRLEDLRLLRESLRSDLRQRMASPAPLSAPLAIARSLPPPPILLGAAWVFGLACSLVLLAGFCLTMFLHFHSRETAQTLRAVAGTPGSAGSK